MYLESARMSIKSQLEYKWPFILASISQFFLIFCFYFMIIGLFNKFSNIKGFTLYEVLLTFSIIHIGFSFNETFFRGIDSFEDLIIDGSLDRFLVRPRGILFQTLCHKMDLVKIFRIIQAFIIMIIAVCYLNITLTFDKILCLVLMNLSSIAIFFGLFVLTASYCFFTIEGLEIKNVLTDGGKHMAQYPISIYRKGIIFVFTFIIPYAFINYYPLLYFLGRSDNKLYLLSPLIVFIFLIPCLCLFNFGLKHYNSTGS